ncbi:alpha,alpha-trehalase TreA [Salegentibacter sp. F188]|uniref:Alpha,alpha-trehalase TreA n=1 Tax=Autumnicola patrickiae TaxID=3075591 RepID=A0ABU3DXD6_9FLAO|nr:alpha,alpha-trehalase TreA [Salegentibacter sp. F188]MDT0688387.1 alpha,alpha-trehalase TreA [Salegentibacter sp. F188]
MIKAKTFGLVYSVIFSFLLSCSSVSTEQRANVTILPPEELYGELFYDVQTKEIFPDSKTFVDAIPKKNVKEIRREYKALEDKSMASISAFVEDNFEIPGGETSYEADSSSINQHIKKLWQVLKRPADEQHSGTLIPLPNPYIVPGGRFREIYYWDSYFTMLGLQEDGETETIRNMVDNFAYLINNYGFIPNGNRTYYLGRSQPPFFAMMVQVLAEEEGDEVYVEYLEEMQKEYEFWMAGAEKLNSGKPSHRRVVQLAEGEILNRYWDDNPGPRPESYREDIKTAEDAVTASPNLTKEEVYIHLRAGAESGWDYSSRWLDADASGEFDLSTIHTTNIIPVDLNSLLYNLEGTIAKTHDLAGNSSEAEKFSAKQQKRKNLILKYCWNRETKFFMDYNFRRNKYTEILSLAGVYPLFFEIADGQQASQVAEKIENKFLKPGGVVTTLNPTGEQWDAPNGWAPLQWVTITGLRNYGKELLADEIKMRWLQVNQDVYDRTYKMLEKYNVEDLTKESGGGEYPTQDGFGWTNGVFQKLSAEE